MMFFMVSPLLEGRDLTRNDGKTHIYVYSGYPKNMNYQSRVDYKDIECVTMGRWDRVKARSFTRTNRVWTTSSRSHGKGRKITTLP